MVNCPDLAVTKSGPVAPVVPGSPFIYRVWVLNRGTAPATGVVLTDVLPAEVLFLEMFAPGWGLTIPPVGTSGAIAATRSEAMPPGRQDYLEIRVQLDQSLSAGTTVINTASASSTLPERDVSNNASSTSVTAAAPQADLRLWVSGLTEVNSGSRPVFQVFVSDAGPSQATAPEWSLVVPPGLTFRSLVPPAGWTCSMPAVGAAGTVACSAASLATGPALAAALTLDVTATPGATLTLTGSISSATPDPVTTNNTPSHSITVLTDGNDSLVTATPVGSGPKRVKGRLYPAGDIDYYSFAGNAGDRVYAAVMTAGPAGSSIDTTLTLFGPDGTAVIETDDNDGTYGTTSSSIAGVYLPSGGTYVLAVMAAPAVSTGIGPYDLYVHVRSGSPTAESEPGGNLPPSRWVSGVVPVGDIDTFAVAVSAGDTVFVSLDMDPASALGVRAGGTRWNGTLSLTPPGGSAIAAADANAVSPNSEALFATLRSAGTITLTVSAASGAGPGATYHLSVAIVPAADESCTTYASTDAPKAIGPEPAAGGVESTGLRPGRRPRRPGRRATGLDAHPLPGPRHHADGSGRDGSAARDGSNQQ